VYQKQNNYRLLNIAQRSLFALIFMAFTGCSGDDEKKSENNPPSGNNQPNTSASEELASRQVINGVNVPRQPVPGMNTGLLGVDTNNNGVRDDVERVIAAEYGNPTFDSLIPIARNYQSFLSIPESDSATLVTTFHSIARDIFCFKQKNPNLNPDTLQKVSLITHDSSERRIGLRNRMKALNGIAVSIDTSACGSTP